MLIGSKCHSWTWHPLIHHLKPVWEIHLSLIRFDYKVFPCVVFESMLPNHWSCHPYVQELSIWNLYWVGHLQLSILSVSAFPVSSPTYIILCFTFKICYSFHVIDGGYIKALLWRVLFRRLQLIIRKQDLEILWYLGTCMPQWKVSSLSILGFHYWPLIRRFC